ncbi:MAG: hypothetical protein A3I88_01390 [Candidatus Portnoybacteria bacterium RIFCSPLOWO2_12_FULL_39_9]|uniref:RNA-directed DNA polymerase n=1 Tax=Candidatus Portnoybacteria bacterium RIFCSPHIGHO2_12_FULL_38_9 TaxID=1801997 RepID=A0A1G2FIW9_9BACT|nr:MAG: hypothetical protein A3H00_01425 [Candidatus Portnoybacteria bacterium RBG_13_40_8]OGZ36634.1 MAG: hypothetical protein A2646_00450 [Candidatus Portnoybacteria bacterium RIFCSPHIGHO2_02_FULL_39_12]OGZ37528.1 MAG: hypothetical protein A3J64_00875 [Candidatus Portnoybacteria bacterium RIFCSPHIGHO2_12_FULL_38_9]OGZ39352.1 MAG: hypothetical protein A3F21_02715 [Candidatus Portnoybacteria bacterium RIFCSPLOWO2_01_FULL_38_39]OGZ39868.1 MAG: hypothetical protein A3I88_01390 [Candidatus Portnoy
MNNEKLKKGINEICNFLEYNPGIMDLEKAFEGRNSYQRIFIRKRGGKKKGKRVIHVPPPKLKNVQSVIHRRVLEMVEWPASVHGFVKNRSHLTAALKHSRSIPPPVALLLIDFKDAFSNVGVKKVERALDKRLQPNLLCPLSPGAIKLLAKLITYRGRLPQGAPSSPTIFNLVALDLDEVLSVYAEERGYTYTRYVDNIAVSSPKPIPKNERAEIIGLCRQFGFQVVSEKARYQEAKWGVLEMTKVLLQPYGGQKWYASYGLGLSNRKFVDKVRAMVHRAQKDPSISLASIWGKIDYVRLVDPYKLSSRLSKPMRQLRSIQSNLERRK